MRHLILTIIFAASMLVGTAQHNAFGDNERLTFIGAYRAKFVPSTDVAKVDVTMRYDAQANTYQIEGVGRTMSFFRWFFDMTDTYRTTLDGTTITPIRSSKDLKENKYRFYSKQEYDWDKKVVRSEWRNLNQPTGKSKVIPITDDCADAVALFYKLRSMNEKDLKIGKEIPLRLVMDDTIKVINYRYLGKEQKHIGELGVFNTLRFSCQLAPDSESGRYEDGSIFYLWISDDENHLPLYIESPVKIGSVRARLTSFSGLKHPVKSKIR